MPKKRLIGLLMTLLIVGGVLPASLALAGQPTAPGDDPDVAFTKRDTGVGTAQDGEFHDLAVTRFEKPLPGSVITGDIVRLAFEITNQGSFTGDETFNWSVEDRTEGVFILRRTGDSLARGFSMSGLISWDTTGASVGNHELALSVEPVDGETSISNNTKTVIVDLTLQPKHGVIVTDLVVLSGDGVTPVGTADVQAGLLLHVKVTMFNTGDVPEDFTLTVSDTFNTTINIIATLGLTIGSGNTITVSVPWNTPGVLPGDHSIEARATDSFPASSKSTVIKIVATERITFDGDIETNFALFPADPNGTPLVLMTPNVETQVAALTNRFIRGHDALFGDGVALIDLNIDTQVVALTNRFIRGHDALFGDGVALIAPNVETQVAALTNRFIRGHDALFGDGVALIDLNINTQVAELTNQFIRGHDALFGQNQVFLDPFANSRIRSTGIHIQRRSDSTGAFLRVDGQVHFIPANGRVDIPVKPGIHDIIITAPGYVYVALVDVQMAIGAVLEIPELTLPFGDANGDGEVGIEDLAFLGANFGTQWHEISP